MATDQRSHALRGCSGEPEALGRLIDDARHALPVQEREAAVV